MIKNFLSSNIDDAQRKFIQDIVDLGLSFYKGDIRENLVIKYKDNDNLIALIEEDLPYKEGKSLENLFKDLEQICKYSISQSDPRYMAFPDTGNSLAGIISDILKVFLNQNLIAVDRSAPIATFVEIQVLLWLRQLIGYSFNSLTKTNSLSDIGGMWTSGGNMSNHIAMMVALNYMFPSIKEKGIFSLEKKPSIVLAKDIAHFSFKSAALALGLGEKNIIWTSTTENYTSNIDNIRKTLLNTPKDKSPFMLICVAGNCRTTSIDNIIQMRRIADDFGLWLHVDACHGGNLLFSKTKKQMLKGIELADSVSLDPHKGLFLTYPSSYIFFKDPKALTIFSRYPSKTLSGDVYDLGLITPFYGSKGFESLKLWLLIKNLGVDGIGKLIDQRNALNAEMTHLLRNTSLFTFLNTNTFYRVAFIFFPDYLRNSFYQKITQKVLSIEKGISLINKYTELFCEALYKNGKVVFDRFSLPDFNNNLGLNYNGKLTVMGMAIGQHDLTNKIKEDIINEVKKIGSQYSIQFEKELNFLHTYSEENSRNDISPASW
ncbi:hypothetical protein AB832_07095 [Flavobacteriaceae bacterium (ex Bugula neritina AB1)]|nr:hypothetical protein AB832_07095 [Flavobacteriaceae bacterium (ex Bugula neritina AB1)]